LLLIRACAPSRSLRDYSWHRSEACDRGSCLPSLVRAARSRAFGTFDFRADPHSSAATASSEQARAAERGDLQPNGKVCSARSAFRMSPAARLGSRGNRGRSRSWSLGRGCVECDQRHPEPSGGGKRPDTVPVLRAGNENFYPFGWLSDARGSDNRVSGDEPHESDAQPPECEDRGVASVLAREWLENEEATPVAG
jgi:hypothetical protein